MSTPNEQAARDTAATDDGHLELLDALEPSGAARSWPHECDNHPGVPAWAMCSRCGRYVCRGCHRQADETAFALCPTCKAVAVGNAEDESTTAAGAVGASSNTSSTSGATPEPAEIEPRRVGDFPKTLLRVLLSPTRFFSTMHPRAGWMNAALFGIAASAIGTMFGLMWAVQFGDAEPLLAEARAETGWPAWVLYLGVLAALPIAAGLELLLYAAGVVVILRLFGTQAPFVTTAKIAGYSMAGKILAVIPYIGGPVALVALLAVMMIGVRRVYDTPFLRSAVAVAVTVLLVSMLGLVGTG